MVPARRKGIMGLRRGRGCERCERYRYLRTRNETSHLDHGTIERSCRTSREADGSPRWKFAWMRPIIGGTTTE